MILIKKNNLIQKKGKGFIKVNEDPFEIEWSGISIEEVKNMLVIYQEFKIGNNIKDLIEKQSKIKEINPEKKSPYKTSVIPLINKNSVKTIDPLIDLKINPNTVIKKEETPK